MVAATVPRRIDQERADDGADSTELDKIQAHVESVKSRWLDENVTPATVNFSRTTLSAALLSAAYGDFGTWRRATGTKARLFLSNPEALPWLIRRIRDEKQLDTIEAIAALLVQDEAGVLGALSIIEASPPHHVRLTFLNALTTVSPRTLAKFRFRLGPVILKLRDSTDEDEQQVAQELSGLLQRGVQFALSPSQP